MRRGTGLRIVRRRPRQRGGCGANQLAARCPSAAGRRRVGRQQGSAGRKAVVRYSRRFGRHWRGRGGPSRRAANDRGKLLLQTLAQAAQTDHPAGFYRPSATSDPIGKRFTQDATGWKSSYGALLEGGIHFVALGADLFADAPPASNRRVPRTPSGRAGAEFDSAGRIPIREQS